MKLTPIALALVALNAHAQTAGVGTKPAYVAPSYTMPAGKIYVDVSKIPKPRTAHKSVRIKESCTDPTCSGSDYVNQYTLGAGEYNSGSFRINCALSHVAFDDPLVYPGQAGRTHGHQFFGNTKTRAAADISNMSASGDSTCAGGILNRTGYWTPFMVYHCPAATAVARGCNAARDGEPFFGLDSNFYYKNNGAISSNTTVWPPANLRMISGNASATTALPNEVGLFQCYGNDGFTHNFNHIPTTAEGAVYGGCNKIDMIIAFQQCWDGVNLDSPDHQSHMQYRPYYQTCATAYPSTFPVTLLDISLNVFFKITNQADLDFLRLSSDPPAAGGQPGGWTAHADWVDGWDRSANLMGWGAGNLTDILMLQCGSKGLAGNNTHRDCHNHLLGRPNPAKPTTTYTLY